MNHLVKQDSLTLDICNGFQVLIKLGVFDVWKIKPELSKNDEFLRYNDSLRHEIGLVRTKFTSLLSLFLQRLSIVDEYLVPFSYGD
mgnify:CR=1 FL=1